jgi:hypothetical protein
MLGPPSAGRAGPGDHRSRRVLRLAGEIRLDARLGDDLVGVPPPLCRRGRSGWLDRLLERSGCPRPPLGRRADRVTSKNTAAAEA